MFKSLKMLWETIKSDNPYGKILKADVAEAKRRKEDMKEYKENRLKDKVLFSYRKYEGSIHFSVTHNRYYGKLKDIVEMKDKDKKNIKYRAATLMDLMYAFRECVDEHIASFE